MHLDVHKHKYKKSRLSVTMKSCWPLTKQVVVGPQLSSGSNSTLAETMTARTASLTSVTLVPVVQLTIYSGWICTLTWTDNNILFWDILRIPAKPKYIQNVFKLPQIQLNICILTCNRYQYLLPTKTTVLLHHLRPAITIESCYHTKKHKQFKDNKKSIHI